MEQAQTNYPDEVVSAGQLLRILDTDAREISTLCQRACLKPKKDGFGNIYFSKGDVDVLRKVKELYEYTKKLQDEKQKNQDISPIKENKLRQKPKFDFLNEQIKPEIKKTEPAAVQPIQRELPMPYPQNAIARKIDALENSVVSKITDVLSEKLDGLDEVIVELIKAKTENESLRQKINDLNKENFTLKSENLSYKPVGLGLYIKKPTDEITF